MQSMEFQSLDEAGPTVVKPTLFAEALDIRPLACIFPFILVSAELLSVALTGDTFFGTVTGGVVQSFKLLHAASMRWHMYGGATMWALAGIQYFGKNLRKGPWSVLHRISGRVFLILWFFLVGPTALHLSLLCGTGPNNLQFAMTLFSIASIDTALLAYYFFIRAWIVALRRQSEDSLKLHGQAMTIGTLFTMTIIVQRPLQLLMIIFRAGLVFAADAAPASWTWARSASKSLTASVFDYNSTLAFTTCLYGLWLAILYDGPRTWVFQQLVVPTRHWEELFGSLDPGFFEKWFWRCRLPAYLILRAMVTHGWTIDPNPRLVS